MHRREFITLLGGAAAAWPLAARAQAPKLAQIGFVATGSLDSAGQQLTVDAFRQELRERGYVEGQNIIIEYRFADGKIERFPELVTELVHLSLDLIVASNTPAARAAKQAATTISIVVPVMGDPIGDGLVVSLAIPAALDRNGAGIRGTRWLDGLWSEHPRPVSPRRCLRGYDSPRHQASRSARSATDEIRASHQPQNRKGARPHFTANTAGDCRRGDRVSAPGKAGAIQPVEVRPK
jgi:hypothetical protein